MHLKGIGTHSALLKMRVRECFFSAVAGKTENTINRYVLWTDEQKSEWEELWLTEPEGE
jgi:hypothetical protein